MSADIVISVENLGKRYSLSHLRDQRYIALRDVLVEKATGLFRRNSDNGSRAGGQEKEEFWALKNVSFEVKPGEVVGIIGRNGAGKSTLLKILSRITEPTEGRVRIKGRVASLLEVGTGFHPELTGRENIFLNGAILGMSREEINRKFDPIVAFAEVERFLDTPVKRYSSGMYVRLAFAVAAHLDPEILVVDEVLAVGDAQFQKKCLGKMQEVSTQEGRTVLFVSHNMDAIRRLCTTGLWLDRGRVQTTGPTATVVNAYIAVAVQQLTGVWERPENAADAAVVFKRIAADLIGEQPDYTLRIELQLETRARHPAAFMDFDLISETGITVMQVQPRSSGFIHDDRPIHQLVLEVELPPLVPGTYTMTAWLGSHNDQTLDRVEQCVSFTIHQSPVAGRTYPHTPDHGFIVPRTVLTYN